MTKRKHQARIELRKAADELVAEMHAGKWDHVPNLRSRPMESLTELFDELESRCPGHSREEYKETFLRSHWEFR
jgi:hypothetical protein